MMTRARSATGLAVAAAVLVLPVTALAIGAASFSQFTSANLGFDNAPSWSPDGQYVYYSTRVTGFPYIYRKAANAPMNQSGTRLTDWEIEELSASASPDGGWVVMAVRDTIGRTHLWRVPALGGPPLTKMTLGPYSDLHPAWWGTGASQQIAFATNRVGTGYQIATLVPNGTLLATQMTAVTGTGYEDLHPSWSPDGQAIAFSSNRGGGKQIFVVSRAGAGWGAPLQLTAGGGDKSNPAFSPSGLSIAYEVSSGSGTSLWIMDADGSNARMITGAGDYDAEPAWSPGSDEMAFVSDRTGGNYIWLIHDVSTPAAPLSWGRVKANYR